jgi:nitroimidazol reductase NimA-like FMN-containing flavoprotein (pyridoxamine 5'-phosphate oxidase superfamily)
LSNGAGHGAPEYKRANSQYIAMSEAEVWQLIGSAVKTIVSFTMDDGYPHSTPVWFCVMDRKIYFRSQNNKVKLRLAHDGKACCVWEEGLLQRELRGVVVWGKARVVDSKELEERAAQTLAAKYREFYWKESEVPGWLKGRRESRSIVEIDPVKISSWDNRKVAK